MHQPCSRIDAPTPQEPFRSLPCSNLRGPIVLRLLFGAALFTLAGCQTFGPPEMGPAGPAAATVLDSLDEFEKPSSRFERIAPKRESPESALQTDPSAEIEPTSFFRPKAREVSIVLISSEEEWFSPRPPRSRSYKSEQLFSEQVAWQGDEFSSTTEIDLESRSASALEPVEVPLISQSSMFSDSDCGETDCATLSFREDVHGIWPRLRDDTKGLVNWNNAAILGAALGGSLLIRSELDDDVREAVERHPQRWGDGSDALGWLGDPTLQVPVMLGAYAWSLRQQDEELHDLMGTMISAYTINGVVTVTVKGIANTDRPSDDWNGGKFGFPSFHTSSSFAIAAVLDEYYGCRAGIPAYMVAGLVGWSRIDEQDHDLSDVVFGAALGWVIGKSVSRRHLEGDSRVRLLPYMHPTDGSSGLMLDVAF
ncbi:MAG: phosphatase PAP2 family protein [Planctomycetaceae bacterium]